MCTMHSGEYEGIKRKKEKTLHIEMVGGMSDLHTRTYIWTILAFLFVVSVSACVRVRVGWVAWPSNSASAVLIAGETHFYILNSFKIVLFTNSKL